MSVRRKALWVFIGLAVVALLDLNGWLLPWDDADAGGAPWGYHHFIRLEACPGDQRRDASTQDAVAITRADTVARSPSVLGTPAAVTTCSTL